MCKLYTLVTLLCNQKSELFLHCAGVLRLGSTLLCTEVGEETIHSPRTGFQSLIVGKLLQGLTKVGDKWTAC